LLNLIEIRILRLAGSRIPREAGFIALSHSSWRFLTLASFFLFLAFRAFYFSFPLLFFLLDRCFMVLNFTRGFRLFPAIAILAVADRRGGRRFFPTRDHEGVNILPRPRRGCSPPSASSGIKADVTFRVLTRLSAAFRRVASRSADTLLSRHQNSVIFSRYFNASVPVLKWSTDPLSRLSLFQLNRKILHINLLPSKSFVHEIRSERHNIMIQLRRANRAIVESNLNVEILTLAKRSNHDR